MVITDFLERNARLYGSDVALVEINPSEERDNAVTWRDYSLIESASPDAPYRREMTWKDFERRANRFANLLLSRGLERGTKVGILLMNCLEWLPLYFGILYYYEGLSGPEIARILGKSESAVRMRLMRARRLLRDYLEEGGNSCV